MLIILLSTHIYLTYILKFIQRYVFKAIKISVTKDKNAEGEVSQFGALATALAATIGTGNIIGVATAIVAGGPGAVFWCWLTGVFGMATKYAECLLAVKYRQKNQDNKIIGGPMYVLDKKLNLKWLAVLFALFGILVSSIGGGCFTQANSISVTVHQVFAVPKYITGLVITFFAFISIMGGVKSISRVCEKLVPFMAIIYLAGCMLILIKNIYYLIPALKLIIFSAFKTRSIISGFIASSFMTAARFGISRGLLSNESGQGSAAIIAAAAKTNNPVKQALVSMTGTFWDTVIVCAITGLTLVSSIIKSPDIFKNLSGANLTSIVFSQINYLGPVFLTISLIIFAFSTILGWSYYGERCFEYLFQTKSIMIYKIFHLVCVFIGSIISFEIVWDIADICTAFMTLPNIISLFLLSKIIITETKKYINSLD